MDQSRAVDGLVRATDPEVQSRFKDVLRQDPDHYPQRLLEIYLSNPVLRLDEGEVSAIRGVAQSTMLGDLVALRNAAAVSSAPRYAVFCMPKSGSSFIKSALQFSLQLPFVSLTGFTPPAGASMFGMNPREQEIDDLAVLKAAFQYPAGFVAQHHTRCSPYLGRQMEFFGIRPIVTIRNILDCIVSFDDMMRQWRGNGGPKHWMFDPQFALPLDYERRDAEDRYTVLTHSLGIWLINFYLSWRRGARHGLVKPIVIRYEEEVLAPDRLLQVLTRNFDFDAAQSARLTAFVASPDKKRARLNVGRKGRGEEMLPEHLKAFLASYVALFRGEFSEDEIRYLVR
jgi:hypothetical protein